MDSSIVDQPRKTETAMVARCSRCGEEIYVETIVELRGKPVERVVVGRFKQSLDKLGVPSGPVIPFCQCN